MNKETYRLAIEAWNNWKDNHNEWIKCDMCKKQIKTFRTHNTGNYCFHCSLWYFQELEDE